MKQFLLGDPVVFLSDSTYPRVGTVSAIFCDVETRRELITIDYLGRDGQWTWHAKNFFHEYDLLDLVRAVLGVTWLP